MKRMKKAVEKLCACPWYLNLSRTNEIWNENDTFIRFFSERLTVGGEMAFDKKKKGIKSGNRVFVIAF